MQFAELNVIALRFVALGLPVRGLPFSATTPHSNSLLNFDQSRNAMRPHTPLLEMLTTKVRLVTSFQSLEFLNFSPRLVWRILRSMKKQGWLNSAKGVFRQPKLVCPIFTWQPALAEPSFQSLAYRLDTRWANTEPTPCHLWWATPAGCGRVRRCRRID